MTSTEGVCRVCLVTDAPVRTIGHTPLQQVYEKLTNVSLNTTGKPVVVCFLCHWQLRKCHKLMSRALIADEVLTKILQTGASVRRELIVMIDRTSYKLMDEPTISRMEQTVFVTPEPKIKEEKIKDELMSYQHEEDELDKENVKHIVDVKIENSDDMEGVEIGRQEDVNNVINGVLADEEDKVQETITETDTDDELYIASDVENTELTDDEQVYEEGKGVEHINENTCIREMNRESLEDTENIQIEGVGPAVICGLQPTHAGTQDSTTPQENLTGTRDTGLQEEHGVDNGKTHFECKLCEKNFKHRSSLNNHLKTHSAEKWFECDVCRKRFNRKCTLVCHLRIHTGETPYTCAVCKKTFKFKSTLYNHSTTHIGRRTFECKVCQKGFHHRSNLHNHMLTHTGEKPHECLICEKRFGRKAHLERHLLTHSGEKPFKCEICPTGFSRKSHLKRHLRVHSANKSKSSL